MMIRTKKSAAILVGVLTFVILAKFTVGAFSRSKEPLRVWIPSEPFSADPIESGFIAHEMAFRSIHAPLVTRHKLGETVGLLAASWRSENQSRSWIVSLRPNLKWSDGVPLTAQDVKTSFLRLALHIGKKGPTPEETR
jgi:ABC-type transport system substrate-binding protein